MKLIHETVNIEDIIKFWVNEYEFEEGESLFRHEHLYDPNKGKVALQLFVNEKEDN